tara:strand:+ start:590 stop:985 length:396 start_codon:yes stop_codon:yes gene_type:complete
MIKDIIEGIAAPVIGVFNKRTERRMAKEAARSKLKLAQQEGQQTVTMTDAEWESLSVQVNENSWKDEYLTIVITSPIVILILGGILAAFGHPGVLTGIDLAVKSIREAGVDMGFLMEAVVLAGMGLKLWRK